MLQDTGDTVSFQCRGDPLRVPRGVAESRDSGMSPTTSRSSPASPSIPFSPSSHRRRPNGKFARPAGLFLFHPNGPNQKPICDHGGTGSLGLHHHSSLGCSFNRCGGGVGSRSTASSALPPSGDSPLSPRLYFTGSTQASISPVTSLVHSSPWEHAPDRPRREFLVNPPYFKLPPVAPVAAAEWLEDLRSALVAQESPESVDPTTGSNTSDLGCWRSLEPKIVSALTLLV